MRHTIAVARATERDAAKPDDGCIPEHKDDIVTTTPQPVGFFKAPNPDPRPAADANSDKWIDVLSTDWGTRKPGS